MRVHRALKPVGTLDSVGPILEFVCARPELGGQNVGSEAWPRTKECQNSRVGGSIGLDEVTQIDCRELHLCAVELT